jgi:hypothetical protein
MRLITRAAAKAADGVPVHESLKDASSASLSMMAEYSSMGLVAPYVLDPRTLGYDAATNPPTVYNGQITARTRTSTVGVPAGQSELAMHGIFVAQALVTRGLAIAVETTVSTVPDVQAGVFTAQSSTKVTAKSRVQRRFEEQHPPKIPLSASHRREKLDQQTRESLFTLSPPAVAALAAGQCAPEANDGGEQRRLVDLLELAKGSPESSELFKKMHVNTRAAAMGGAVTEMRVARAAEVLLEYRLLTHERTAAEVFVDSKGTVVVLHIDLEQRLHIVSLRRDGHNSIGSFGRSAQGIWKASMFIAAALEGTFEVLLLLECEADHEWGGWHEIPASFYTSNGSAMVDRIKLDRVATALPYIEMQLQLEREIAREQEKDEGGTGRHKQVVKKLQYLQSQISDGYYTDHDGKVVPGQRNGVLSELQLPRGLTLPNTRAQAGSRTWL